MPCSRGSFRSPRTIICESSRSTSSATRSDLFTSATISLSSTIDDLEILLAERRESERVDEIHHLAKSGIDERAIVAHLADSQFRALPHIVLVGLANRYVELVSHPRLYRAQHLALALERMVFGKKQGKAQYPNYHGSPLPSQK